MLTCRKTFKVVKHKLTEETDVISNGELVVRPATQTRKIMKSISDDVHCAKQMTQKRSRRGAWWPG